MPVETSGNPGLQDDCPSPPLYRESHLQFYGYQDIDTIQGLDAKK